jgi:hypothetical protein
MNRLLCLLLLFAARAVSAQPDTTLAIGKCAGCDTLYKKNTFMPDGSPMIRKVTCYYADEYGNRTDEEYSIVRFRNGLKHGAEKGFYRKQEWLYLSWLKKPVSNPSRFMLFLTEIGWGYAPLFTRYSGNWRKGIKEYSWTYFDTLQRVVSDTAYLHGKPNVFDGGISGNVDLEINGNGQTLRSEDGDTLWLWNVANNQLQGDFLFFTPRLRIREQYTFENGRLLSKKLFWKGIVRREEFYDRNGTIIEFYRYDNTGEPVKHKLLAPSYSYRPARYVNAGIP